MINELIGYPCRINEKRYQLNLHFPYQIFTSSEVFPISNNFLSAPIYRTHLSIQIYLIFAPIYKTISFAPKLNSHTQHKDQMNPETPTERKPRRHFIASSCRLKGNKVTVGETKSKPQKPKKDDQTHVPVESPEFQLLVRLYVPAKLLIKNNKVLRKQLSYYLPVIVNESVPELNFELHIFLSSVVTAYVLSWYLNKLNTDYFEFLENVYGILCDFVKDFARRVLAVVELPNLLTMVEEWASILDHHIRLVQLDDGIPCLVGKYLEKNRHCVMSDKEMTPEAAIDHFLQESHVIFSQRTPPPAEKPSDVDDEASGVNYNIECPPDPLLTYLRVTTRNILTATFSENNEATFMGQGPTSSAIATNLVVIVVADLVFSRILSKLASPQFLLLTVMGNLAGIIAKQGNTPVDATPLHKKIISALKKVHIGISNITVAFTQGDSVGDSRSSLLYSPIVSLADSITNISARKPVVAQLARIGRSILLSSRPLSTKFDSISRSYLLGVIRLSPVLKDKFLAGIVEKLTDTMFSRNKVNPPRDGSVNTIEDLATLWFDLLQSPRFPMSLLWFTYSGESEEDIKTSLMDFFAIFDTDSKDYLVAFSPSNRLNMLLIIRLFDSIVQGVYPELVESGYSAQV